MNENQDDSAAAPETTDAVRLLATCAERIAQAVENMEKMYSEECRRRQDERTKQEVKLRDWEDEQKRLQQETFKSDLSAPRGYPPLPWQCRVLWIMLVLLLILFAVQAIVSIYTQINVPV
jgi:hypothetical protein